jgi:pimeloyl-ACP methyl ester carboxylesterase
VTAVVRFEGRRAVIGFEDPLATETTTLDGHRFPLAADFTVPLAVMLARENPKKLEIARVLNPDKYAKTAHIVRLQPYDPNKTVVLVTHGLMDSPATWTPMLNTLRGDPYIREHYQFWFYSYPSGYPYPYSASIMRHQLDAIEKRFPLRKPIVLIGHSMGSLISRLMITDSNGTLWLAMFGKPPSETHLSPTTKRMLEESLEFHHRPDVGRVIFISAPHRGSNLASNWVGRIGSRLITAPIRLLAIAGEAATVMTVDPTALQVRRMPNSIDTLAPNNRFVKAINTIPITPGIPYHSIMGDRGKGGNKDKTPPVSTDGVVPYWSSHLDGARSELIVPSNHSAHQNPQAIAEVRRILKLNTP